MIAADLRNVCCPDRGRDDGGVGSSPQQFLGLTSKRGRRTRLGMKSRFETRRESFGGRIDRNSKKTAWGKLAKARVKPSRDRQ